MTHLYNDPAEFKNDVLKGFAAAYPHYVQRVEGASGFVRAGGPLEGKVSLVIGGGSGHFPSYNGVVGTGFADGAVLRSRSTGSRRRRMVALVWCWALAIMPVTS
jgi:dihydroxyacetone kinase